MKRISVLCLALCLCAGMAFAQDAKLEPLMAPGDLAVTAGIGYGFFWGAMTSQAAWSSCWANLCSVTRYH